MSNVTRLLTDLQAQRVGLLEVYYKDANGQLGVYRATDAEWTTSRSDDIPDLVFHRTLASDLNSEVAIDAGETLGGLAMPEHGVWELTNVGGSLDAWRGYSVDGLLLRYLVVGRLSDGTEISYSEASGRPLLVGRGIGRPRVSTRKVTIAYQSGLYGFDRPLAMKLFSPPCLMFPGTGAGCVDFGDSWDLTGSFTVEFWINTLDPSVADQIIFSKDTGAAGFYATLNPTGGAGAGSIRFGIRNQTSAVTDTAAGLIPINSDKHVAVVWNAATATRTVYVDGTSVASTSGIAGGSAANTAAAFKVGSGFKGRISKGAVWNAARSTEIRANMFLPLIGTETNLTALLDLEENKGTTTQDRKSSTAGALGAGVTWATSTWCGSSLVGKKWPVVVGKALDLPLTPLDPANPAGPVFATAWPPPVAAPVVRSNHNALVLGAGYTYDQTRGLVMLTGAATGKYSADVFGQTAFRGAVQYDGATGYAIGTVPCPAESMSLAAMFRVETTSSAARRIAGWTAAAAGQRNLTFASGAFQLFRFVVRNDAGTAFSADAAASPAQNRFYSALGVLDIARSRIQLYLDGLLMATTLVTGTFLATQTAFAIGRDSPTGTGFFPGIIDEVSVWSAPLDTGKAEGLAIAPVVAGTSNLTQCWHCDEGAGTTLGNAVVGGVALTLSGTTSWAQSRIAPVDVVSVVATHYAGYGNHAVLLDGSTGYGSGTVSCPSGAMALGVWVRPDFSGSTVRHVLGWDASGAAGKRALEFASGATNAPQFEVVNDQGSTFTATYLTSSLSSNVWTALLGVLDPGAAQVRLYVDGVLAATTAVTGTFTSVGNAFAVGRRATTGTGYWQGGLDELLVYSRVPSATEASAVKSQPALDGTAGLLHVYHCDEGEGFVLGDSTGGATLSLLGGVSWLDGSAPAGVSLRAPALDMSAAAAFLRDTAADCSLVVQDDATARDAMAEFLVGLTSYLRCDPVTRHLQMGQVKLPSGTPDSGADFTASDLIGDIEPADDALTPPVYQVVVRHARNLSPMGADQLAGLLTTQPARYQFAIAEWREAPESDGSVLADFPAARVLVVDSPLINYPDASSEAARTLPLYGPDRLRYIHNFRASGLLLAVAGEARFYDSLPVPRLGFGSPGLCIRLLSVQRAGRRVTTRSLI